MLTICQQKKTLFAVRVDGRYQFMGQCHLQDQPVRLYNIHSGVNNTLKSNTVNTLITEPSSSNVPQVTPHINKSQNVPSVTTFPPKLTVEESWGLAKDIEILVLKGEKRG